MTKRIVQFVVNDLIRPVWWVLNRYPFGTLALIAYHVGLTIWLARTNTGMNEWLFGVIWGIGAPTISLLGARLICGPVDWSEE